MNKLNINKLNINNLNINKNRVRVFIYLITILLIVVSIILIKLRLVENINKQKLNKYHKELQNELLKIGQDYTKIEEQIKMYSKDINGKLKYDRVKLKESINKIDRKELINLIKNSEYTNDLNNNNPNLIFESNKPKLNCEAYTMLLIEFIESKCYLNDEDIYYNIVTNFSESNHMYLDTRVYGESIIIDLSDNIVKNVVIRDLERLLDHIYIE